MGRPYPPRTRHCRHQEVSRQRLVCCLDVVLQSYWDMPPNLGGSSFAKRDRMFAIRAGLELVTFHTLLDHRFCRIWGLEPLPRVFCTARAYFVWTLGAFVVVVVVGVYRSFPVWFDNK